MFLIYLVERTSRKAADRSIVMHRYVYVCCSLIVTFAIVTDCCIILTQSVSADNIWLGFSIRLCTRKKKNKHREKGVKDKKTIQLPFTQP
jgi:hypothetical protein